MSKGNHISGVIERITKNCATQTAAMQSAE